MQGSQLQSANVSPFFVAEGQEDAILSYEPVTRQESKFPSESLALELVS